MKALYLEKVGSPLELKELPEPELRSGGAVVKILAVPVLSYMKKVLSGELSYYILPTPLIPGANGVGIVESVADDVVGLQPGQMVYFNPYVYTHTNTDVYDGILIGLTSLSPDDLKLQQIWRNGTFAEKALCPAESLTVIDAVKSVDPKKLAVLSYAAVAYGGLLKGNFRPGQTLVVNGATGDFGGAGILVALAMQASRIVAVGREPSTLAKLQAVDPQRVVPVSLTGNLEEDSQQIAAAAQGAHLVLDILGSAPTADATVSAIQALRRGGTAVFMGGVQAAVSIPYMHVMLNELTITGKFMYPESAPRELVSMLEAGTLKLDAINVQGFALEQFTQALDSAAETKGLEYSILVPRTAILNLRFDKESTVTRTSYGSNVFDEPLPNLSQ